MTVTMSLALPSPGGCRYLIVTRRSFEKGRRPKGFPLTIRPIVSQSVHDVPKAF